MKQKEPWEIKFDRLHAKNEWQNVFQEAFAPRFPPESLKTVWDESYHPLANALKHEPNESEGGQGTHGRGAA